ncbi:uncharacterized protein BX663DRAFT_435600 [Cokeromyces recurvatus]|uniref:uncharacterized protein n=1 Tax=Cokeromyces recurvatus TaxID=90255 RepID=UPI00221F4399|nr:uncharacterized protein BX663DRAFT_435600 [Cokeromyces recurvatus]KAI7902329.1 hypothetical protein BX663DRAFT_435600 [Cokeromyces recurvatus]
MFACQRTLFNITIRKQFHTASIICAKNEGGLLGKLNPWAKKEAQQEVTPAQNTSDDVPKMTVDDSTKVTFNVQYEEPEDIISWKKTDMMKDPTEIETTVKTIILQHVQGATEANWNELSIQDLNTKFQIIKESIKQTGKEVPNHELNKLKSTKDVIEFFKTEHSKVKDVQDYLLEQESLPPNIKFIPKQ